MLTIPGAFIREVRGLGRILSKHGIDLVHANGARACVAALVAALRAHIPCVWHVRDYPKHVLVVRALLAGSALTLAPSAFIASALRDIRSRAASRIRVVANGVARPVVDSSAAKEIRRALLPSASAPLITMVAQIVPWKGHLLFLEAATLVAAHLPDARFALVGNDLWGLNGAYEEAVREQANTGILKGRVHLLGYREDIGTVLAASNIMVLPSHNEPFGRVVVEAWHSKCAVVVSNIGGPAGLVEDGVTGLHFHDGDAESLACAIRRLVSDPLLRNGMATAGAKRAEQYSESSHVQGVLAAYRELLA